MHPVRGESHCAREVLAPKQIALPVVSIDKHLYDMGMQEEPTLDHVRAAVSAARVALARLQHDLWQPAGADLPVILGELDALGSAVRASCIAVTAEALSRGEVRDSHAANTVAWLREHAPSLRQGGAKAVADCAELIARQRTRPDPAEPAQLICQALLSGTLTPPVAVTVVSEMDRMATRLRPETHATVAAGLIDLGAEWGSAQVRRLRPRVLADYGQPGELQADQDTLARFVSLTTPMVVDGLTTYQLTLDPVSAATVEAAIGPLAAPAPNDETGERDLRPHGRRRAEALVEVCRRASAAGDQLPGASKTALFVTVDYQTLRTSLAAAVAGDADDRADVPGAGSVVGTPAAGVLLAPETVRRLACDAELIPTVLGSRGEPLELGASVRLFTKGQVRALWLRDGGCSFPGCTIPAHWSDAHHLIHWADDGPTDLGNAALLCQRHHTIVHRDRLHASVDPPISDPTTPSAKGESGHGRVHWDTCPGSYDRALAARRAA